MRVLTLVIVCVFLTMYNCYISYSTDGLVTFFVCAWSSDDSDRTQQRHPCTYLRCNDWLFENHNKTATTSLAWPGPGPGPGPGPEI